MEKTKDIKNVKKTEKTKKKNPLLIGLLVLILIVIVIATNYFIQENKRNNSFKAGEELLLTAAKLYYDYNPSKLPTDDFDVSEVSLKTLRDKSLIKSILFEYEEDTCDEDNSFVKVVKIDDEYEYIVYLSCSTKTSDVNLEPIEFEFSSTANIYLSIGSNLEIPEILNNDDYITKSISIDSSSFDSSKEGSFVITYTAYDNNYNVATKSIYGYVTLSLLNRIEDSLNENGYIDSFFDNSYIMYSNTLWEIIGLNEDGTLKVVSFFPVKNMGMGSETGNYVGSEIDTWLNDEFYSMLYKPETYTNINSKWCVYSSNVTDKIYECSEDEYHTAAVGMLNTNDILNTNKKVSSNAALQLMTSGNDENEILLYISSNFYLNSNTIISNVRASINLNVNYQVTGDGNLISPYMFVEEAKANENKLELTDVSVGEYVTFGNIDWIVSETTNDDLTLISVKYLENGLKFSIDENTDEESLNKEGGLLHYLNNDFLSTLDESYLIEKQYEISRITDEFTFSYEQFLSNDSYKVFILNYDDFYNGSAIYSSVYADSIMMSTVGYETTEKSSYFADLYYGASFPITSEVSLSVRPKITITNKGGISSGDGTFIYPYEIK